MYTVCPGLSVQEHRIISITLPGSHVSHVSDAVVLANCPIAHG